jgi:hypothetical protein
LKLSKGGLNKGWRRTKQDTTPMLSSASAKARRPSSKNSASVGAASDSGPGSVPGT